MTKISSLAVVSPEAQIGSNVEIQPFAIVEGDTIIGDDSVIESHAIIKRGTRMGKSCRVFPGAIVGSIPQDLKYKGEKTTLEIGDRTTIREYCTINIGTVENDKTVIGNDCLIMAYCHVAHDCIIHDNVILVNNVNLAGHVEIEDFAILGGLTAVQQFVKIGKHTYIGGGSLVRKDIPPYIRAAKEPLAYIGINGVGLSRRGFSEEQIKHINQVYKNLYAAGYNISQATQHINTEVETPYAKEILSFVTESKNGVVGSIRK